MPALNIKILGGGVFGLSSAWALAARGHSVEVLDQLPFFDPLISSHDTSKAIRSGYGEQTWIYAPKVAQARQKWLELEELSGRKIYHETGNLQLCSRVDGQSFESIGARWLQDHGQEIEWLSCEEVLERWPVLDIPAQVAAGGWFERMAGWLDPQEALIALRMVAESLGARCSYESVVPELSELRDCADAVLVCAGAWLPEVLPQLQPNLSISEQVEIFVRPRPNWSPNALPCWSLDLSGIGLYGFPPQTDGVVKVALHRPGLPATASAARSAKPVIEAQIADMVAELMPGLSTAERSSRSCLYTKTADGGFVFAAIPGMERTWVAGGGSGHAFKFGSILGTWSADMLEAKPLPESFRWPRVIGECAV